MYSCWKSFKDLPPPHGLIVDVTSRCNLSCRLCFKLNYSEEDLATLITKIRKARKEINFSTVFLFGGEPTVRRDLFRIIKELKKLGLRVALFTNGIKLNDIEYVRMLKKLHLDHVTLSFDSLYDNVYKKIRGKPLLKAKLRALKNLNRVKIPVSIFSVLTHVNPADDIHKILLLRLKFPVIRTIYISTLSREGKIPKDITPLSSSERIKRLCSIFRMGRHEVYFCDRLEKTITQYLWKITKRPLPYSSPFCDLVFYFYVGANRLVPFSRIIRKEKIKEVENICKSNRKCWLHLIKIGVEILKRARFKSIFLRVSLPIVVMIFSNFVGFNSGMTSRLLRVIVTTFQDRQNVDIRTFTTCNLYALCKDGRIRPFCEREIWKL